MKSSLLFYLLVVSFVLLLLTSTDAKRRGRGKARGKGGRHRGGRKGGGGQSADYPVDAEGFADAYPDVKLADGADTDKLEDILDQ